MEVSEINFFLASMSLHLHLKIASTQLENIVLVVVVVFDEVSCILGWAQTYYVAEGVLKLPILPPHFQGWH